MTSVAFKLFGLMTTQSTKAYAECIFSGDYWRQELWSNCQDADLHVRKKSAEWANVKPSPLALQPVSCFDRVTGVDSIIHRAFLIDLCILCSI